MIGTILRDLKHAVRVFLKAPGTLSIAMISLALGLGANATIFSFVDAVLLKPLPVKDADRLLEVWHHRNKARSAFMADLTLSYPDYLYYRDHNNVFASFGGFVPEIQKLNWDRSGTGQAIWAQIVSDEFFAVLGVNPAAGQFLSSEPSEDGIVISYPLWQRLGGAGEVLGQSWMLNGRSLRVLGVAPPRMNAFTVGQSIDIWMSDREARQIGWMIDRNDRRQHCIVGLGRLKANASVAAAQADIGFLGQQLAQAYPDTNADSR